MNLDRIWNRGERIVPGDARCAIDEPMHRARYRFARRYCLPVGDRVVDWGCGVGYGAEVLNTQHYTGVDCSAEAIAYARNQYAAYGNFILSSLTESQVQGTFGIAFELLEHLPSAPQDTVQWLLTRTRTLLISVPYLEVPNRNPWHCHAGLSEETFRQCHGLQEFWYQSMLGDITQSKGRASCVLLAFFAV